MRDRKHLQNSIQSLERLGKKVQIEAGYALHDAESKAIQETQRKVNELLSIVSLDNERLPKTPKAQGSKFIAPLRNPSFVGRASRLEEIHRCLCPPDADIEPHEQSNLKSVVLCGLGGVGKSQLALEYAYRYKASFQACFWVTCESETKITEGFSEISRILDLSSSNVSQTIKSVKDWLQNTGNNPSLVSHERRPADMPNTIADDTWLLIFDNVESPSDMEEFWPISGKGAVLLTTQDSSWLSQEYITQGCRLDVLDADEAVKLVTSLFERKSRKISVEDARDISEETGGLPLAIRQITSYILAESLNTEKFLQIYRDRRRSKSVDAWDESATPWYSHTLATFLDFAFGKLSSRANLILAVISFLDADQIRDSLLCDETEGGDEDDAQAKALCDTALVDQPTTAQVYSFHASFVSDAGDIEQGLDYFEKSLDILKHYLTAIRDTADEFDKALLANAYNNLAAVHYALGNYNKAEMYNEISLLQKEKLAGCGQPMSHLFCLTFQNMASTLAAQRRYDEAAVFFKKAMEVATLKESTSRRALAAHNFGMMRLEQNMVEEAQELFDMAYQLRRKRMGDHPDTAASMHMLACCYQRLGDLDNMSIARHLLRGALLILESRSSNIDERRVARSLFKLSLVEGALDDPKAPESRRRACYLHAKITGVKKPPDSEHEFDVLVPYI
ncbi:P-loop containing nucleoside triphosphate hydrolase protein [Corynascus novoguineensis]|uniref:P-loop containing nucleoside triphosphate hydrolase protein n=1 Tax=Corynascus novoguineensis TaxID=1126955 RepID=A0AAN7CME9_9PEZI|nr:P-loop containing nucleoside triphosphate hydrolase protein [Corynascus novoguineensis]